MSTQENYLKDIADAIREKEGSGDPIPANTFAERILALNVLPPEPPSQLPEGYTELQYITTNHGTSILTDVSATTTTARIICDIEPIEKITSYEATIFCMTKPSLFTGDTVLYLANKASSMTWYAGPASTGSVKNGTFTYDLKKNVQITIDMDGIVGTIKMEDFTSNFSPDNSTYKSPLRFGRVYGSAITAGLSMKIYSAKAYVNRELQGIFKPCKNPDGKVGLYNLVTDYFCINSSDAAGGEPTAGPSTQ